LDTEHIVAVAIVAFSNRLAVDIAEEHGNLSIGWPVIDKTIFCVVVNVQA